MLIDLENKTFCGKITFKNKICSIIFSFRYDHEECIFISIPEFGLTDIPVYNIETSNRKIKFYIWDSPLLGSCEVFESTGSYQARFCNVTAIAEKVVQLYEVLNYHVSEFSCGKIEKYSHYQKTIRSNIYSKASTSLKYTYIFDHAEHTQIKTILNLNYINELEKDFDKAIYVMRMLHKILISKGQTAHVPTKRSGYSLLTRCKEDKKQLNCRGCAIVLNDVLLSIGIPSKFIACMSCDPYDPECHVTNSVYIKEFNKWIYLDAATQSFVVDENDIPMSIWEIHEQLKHGNRLRFMIAPNIQNANLKKHNFENYLIKNMFCFLSYQQYGPYSDDWKNTNKKYLLLPVNQGKQYSELNLSNFNIETINNPSTFFG